MTQAKSFGVECHALSADEAKERFPLHHDRRHRGRRLHSRRRLYRSLFADHGLCQGRAGEWRAASRKASASRRSSSRAGARIGVVTDSGNIACDILVNCAGLWAKRVGAMAGVALAAGIVEHQYFLTEKKLDASTPTSPRCAIPTRISISSPIPAPSPSAAGRRDRKGCWRGMPPLEFGRELFAPNMERLELFALPAAERLPVLNEIGIQTVINGPIPVSADGEPIMGLAPELDNFYRRLRLHRRHRRFGRRRPSHGQHGSCMAMPAWTCGRSTCAASARCMPSPLSRGARHRGLWRLLQDPLAGRGGARGARPARCARFIERLQARRRRVRLASSAGSGRTGSPAPAIEPRDDRRASKASPTGSPRWPRSTGRSASGSRSSTRRPSPSSRSSGAGALAALSASPPTIFPAHAGQGGLHPALQRAGRHRGGRHHHPRAPTTCSSSSPARASAFVTAAGSRGICRTTGR